MRPVLRRVLKMYAISIPVTLVVLFFTSLPLWVMAFLLDRGLGIESFGVRGNLFRGATISKIQKMAGPAPFVAEGVVIRAGSVLDFLLKRRLTVDEVRIGKLDLKIVKLPNWKPGAQSAEQQAEPASDAPTRPDEKEPARWKRMAAMAGFFEFRLNRLQVDGISITHPMSPTPYPVERFEISELVASLRALSLRELAIDSQLFGLRFKIDGKRDVDGVLKVQEELSATIKTAAWKYLKTDIVLEASGDVHDSGYRDFKLAALDKRLKAGVDSAGVIRIETSDLTLSDHFNARIPFHSLNMMLEIGKPTLTALTTAPLSANFKIGNALFTSARLGVHAADEKPGTITLSHDIEGIDGKVTLRLRPQAAVAGGPWLEIGSSQHGNLRDIFAYMHYRRPYAATSLEEQARVDAEVPMFSMAVPAALPQTLSLDRPRTSPAQPRRAPTGSRSTW